MADSPSSNNTPIWVALITVVGSLLSALLINADKWMPRDEKSALAAAPAATPTLQPGPAAPKVSATGALETPVETPGADSPTGPAAPARRDDDGRSTSGRSDSSAPQLEAIAENTVRKYFAAWSDPSDREGRTVGQFYAPTVNFYGNRLSQQELMGEKRKFARRWPSRSYAIQPNSLETDCSQETRACTVAGRIEWQANSNERSSYSSGTASFMLVLKGDVIVAEEGRVLSRQ